MRHALVPIVLCACAALLPCCTARYVTPGRRADFGAMGVGAAGASARPAAPFPATVAVAHVQDAGNRPGAARLDNAREHEEDAEMGRLARLPLVRAVVPMGRPLAPGPVASEVQLRDAAARVQADLLLLYTYDTLADHENRVPLLNVLTLGLFPTREANATATASAALLDVRTGYVYAVAEATDEASQPTNSWTTDSAIEQSRRRAQRRALTALVGQIERSWPAVLAAGVQRPADPRPVEWEVAPSCPAPPPGETYWTFPR